ncbi:response regulator [Metabacillus indicus]|uniref:AraC family transcriptional regulator n=1 Tax=Metabacillus indicus TaxID=246786 RepID=A0A084H1V9_METID|nr:response regulator [Metabacillus indicus]KEZ53571.1 hypothetical protein GS18_0200840 [Metabacillus indicus]
MLKVVIVDDDKIVREGLREFVDWKGMGFEAVQTLSSAEDALHFLESNEADVVLTDIVMDEKNGIDLVRESAKQNEQLKFVLLSGHGEFNYAKEAFKLGVFDYLTKPVQFDELQETFEKLRDVVTKEKMNMINHKLYRNARISQLLNQLVSNHYDLTHSKLDEMSLLFGGKSFTVIRLYITNLHSISLSKEEIEASLQKMISAHPYCYLFNNRLSELAIFASSDSKDRIIQKLSGHLEELERNSGAAVSAGIGKSYDSLEKIAQSYREAGEAITYRYYLEDEKFIDYEAMEKQKMNIYMPEEAKEKIIAFLNHGEFTDLQEYVRGMIEENARINSEDRSIFYDISMELLRLVREFLESRSHIDSITGEMEREFMYTVLKKQTAGEVMEYLESFIKKLHQSLQRSQNDSSHAIIHHVKKYIHDHFGDELSLQRLAEVVYVHPAYLSALFKDKTGENILHYISKVRMERAKILLKDLSLRIYDVSSLVGYESSKHFSKVFKLFTGMTPKEYRNSLS